MASSGGIYCPEFVQATEAGDKVQRLVRSLSRYFRIEDVVTAKGYSKVQCIQDESLVLAEVREDFKKELGKSKKIFDILQAIIPSEEKKHYITFRIRLLVFHSGFRSPYRPEPFNSQIYPPGCNCPASDCGLAGSSVFRDLACGDEFCEDMQHGFPPRKAVFEIRGDNTSKIELVTTGSYIAHSESYSTWFQKTNVPQDVTNLIVTHFRLVAHTMGPVAPGAQLSQNHWSIYLLHWDGSIRLNMILADPRAANTQERLRVTNHGYTTVSTSAVRHWDFPAADNLAIYYVIQLIVENRRAEYDMNARGFGCRHWIPTVMADYVANNYVAAVSSDGLAVADIIGFNYSIGQQPVPLQVQQGRFLRNPRNSETTASGSGSRGPGGFPSAWSEWPWSDQHRQWARYRLLTDGNYEYDYRPAST